MVKKKKKTASPRAPKKYLWDEVKGLWCVANHLGDLHQLACKTKDGPPVYTAMDCGAGQMAETVKSVLRFPTKAAAEAWITAERQHEREGLESLTPVDGEATPDVTSVLPGLKAEPLSTYLGMRYSIRKGKVQSEVVWKRLARSFRKELGEARKGLLQDIKYAKADAAKYHQKWLRERKLQAKAQAALVLFTKAMAQYEVL